jgi:16S rRNA (guanine527-N7)-methyltransferase
MKSVDSDDEVSKAKNAITALGAMISEQLDYTIPDTDIRHRAVIIRKTSKTPEKYPRRFAKIKKSPL